jgi:hypothetical protein
MTKKLWKGRRGRRVVNAQGSKECMLLGWEGLGEQVAEVDGTGDVGDKELVLLDGLDAASGPIEAHVNALRFLARTVSEAKPHAHSLSHKIVVGVWGYPRLDRTGRSSAVTWPLAVGEHTSIFRLGHCSGDDRDSGRVGVDGGVEEEGVGGTEPVVAASYGFGVGAGEVGGAGLCT